MDVADDGAVAVAGRLDAQWRHLGLARRGDCWETDSSYDAWLVFNIWGVSNPDIGQIIPIEPELVIYRDAGVALTQHSLKNPEAKSFITFLSSAQGHAIFKQFGWNK